MHIEQAHFFHCVLIGYSCLMVVTTRVPLSWWTTQTCPLPCQLQKLSVCCTHMSQPDSRSVTKATVAYNLICVALMLSKQRLAWHIQRDCSKQFTPTKGSTGQPTSLQCRSVRGSGSAAGGGACSQLGGAGSCPCRGSGAGSCAGSLSGC